MTYQRESNIEKALVKATEARGGIAYKLTVPGRRNVPDRLLILPGGRLVFVECKAPGEKPNTGQRREHARLRALGCEMYVLDTLDNAWLFDDDEIHDDDLNYTPAYNPLPREVKKMPRVKCEHEGCERNRFAFGRCLRHYREFKANG